MDFRFWNHFRAYGSRFSLKGRIGLGITISRLIFLPVIFLAVYYIAGMVNTTNQIATVDARGALLAEQIGAEITDLRRAEKNYLLLKDPAVFKRLKERSQVIVAHVEDGLDLGSGEKSHFAQMKAAVRTYASTLDQVSQSNEPVQDAAVLNQFVKSVHNYQKRIDALLAAAKQARSQEEISRSVDEISNEAMSFDRFIVQSVVASESNRARQLEELQAKGEEIDTLAREIRENSWKKVEEERGYAEHLGNQATLLITITLAVTLVLSFAFTWYLPRKVLYPIREVTQALRKASNGNYDVILRLSAKDELGELVNEFHNLVEHVKDMDSQRSQPPIMPPTRPVVQQESFTVF